MNRAYNRKGYKTPFALHVTDGALPKEVHSKNRKAKYYGHAQLFDPGEMPSQEFDRVLREYMIAMKNRDIVVILPKSSTIKAAKKEISVKHFAEYPSKVIEFTIDHPARAFKDGVRVKDDRDLHLGTILKLEPNEDRIKRAYMRKSGGKVNDAKDYEYYRKYYLANWKKGQLKRLLRKLE